MLLQGLFGRRGVELDDVEIIGLHPEEALLDVPENVVPSEDVRVAPPGHRELGGSAP
jgi:hypothetical protein